MAAVAHLDESTPPSVREDFDELDGEGYASPDARLVAYAILAAAEAIVERMDRITVAVVRLG